MHRSGVLSAFLVLCSAAALTPACGPPKEVEVPEPSAEITCPAPIGDIPREDCAAVAQEFDALTVTGALQRAGKDPTGVMRTDAIRAAAALANQLKERRVALCESYNACKMPREEHAAKDKQLADLMTALLVLWDARRFSAPDEVERFYGGVRDLATKLAGKGETGPEKPGAGPKKPEAPALTGDKLQQVAAEGIAFSTSGEAVTVQAQAGAPRLVLRSGPSLPLRGGRRYLVKVNGSYTPASPGLVSPGDEVVGRVRYRAPEGGELFIALRSLEDPDASESISTFQVAAGDKGVKEAKFTADPASSGFFLAVGSRGGGPVFLDDVELAHSGTTLGAARAEDASEPGAQTSCKPDTDKPLAGKRSLRCEGQGDLVTLGMPSAYLEIAVRGPSGDRARLRTQSLEGGRSLDATLTEDAELLISVAGAGTATVRGVEVKAIDP